jgi:hypothetical protein
MITAKEAREMAITEEIILVDIEKKIIEAAEKHECSIKYRNHGFGNGDLYHNEPSISQAIIIQNLRKLGFTANVRTEDKQFADIFLEIIW